MKIRKTTEILKEIGWQTYKDEVGDRGACFSLPDRIVDIMYGIDRATRYQQFSSTLSVSTKNIFFSLQQNRK